MSGEHTGRGTKRKCLTNGGLHDDCTILYIFSVKQNLFCADLFCSQKDVLGSYYLLPSLHHNSPDFIKIITPLNAQAKHYESQTKKFREALASKTTQYSNDINQSNKKGLISEEVHSLCQDTQKTNGKQGCNIL